MIELMNRKAKGDQFDYNSFIEANAKKYAIKTNFPTFASIKSQISTDFAEALLHAKDHPKTPEDILQELSNDDEDDEDDDFDLDQS